MNHIDRTIIAGAVAAQTTLADMKTMVKMLLEREDLDRTVENVKLVINALLETKAAGQLKEMPQGNTGPNRKERRAAAKNPVRKAVKPGYEELGEIEQ